MEHTASQNRPHKNQCFYKKIQYFFIDRLKKSEILLCTSTLITSDKWKQTGSLFCVKRGVKVTPQQAEVAQGVPGTLRPRIFLTFGTTRVVFRQHYAPAAFTPGEIPGTHFQRLSRPQGTWFLREQRKNPQWHHRESIPGSPD